MRALALLAALATPAAGQPACLPGAAEAHAERVLALRPDAGRFVIRRIGAAAAHVLIEYRDLGPEAAEAVIAPLLAEARPPFGAEDLANAHAVARGGPAALGDRDAQVAALRGGSMSVMRALMIADPDGFPALAAEAAEEERFAMRYMMGLRPPLAVMGRPVPERLRLAKAALAADQTVLAGAMLATLEDPGPFRAFYAQYGEETGGMLRGGSLHANLLLAASGDALLFHDEDLDPVDQARRQQFQTVTEALWASPGMTFLGILMNQTGEEAASARAAERLLAALADGTVASNDPDAAWVLTHAALSEELGADHVNSALAGFAWPPSRPYDGLADFSMGMVIAAHAFRGADEPPARPDHLPAGFPWDRWVALAADLDALRGLEDETDARIAVELLYGAGREDQLHALLASSFSTDDAIRLHKDLMRRHDRRCEGVLTVEGDGLFLGGTEIYRTD